MKKYILTLFFFLLVFKTLLAQKTYYDYPPGQTAYIGGNVQMFKEIQDFLIKNNLSECENKKEMYWVTLRIDENSKPALIRKKRDIEKAEQNKCAYNLAVKALGSLKNWQAAQIKGENVEAYFDFPFVPNNFFGNYKEGYDTNTMISRPSFSPNGIYSFREEILKNLYAYIDFASYQVKGKFIVFFIIDKDGSTKVLDIEPKVKNGEQLIEDIKFAFKKIKQKWEPAKINGEPVQFSIRMPINFTE